MKAERDRADCMVTQESALPKCVDLDRDKVDQRASLSVNEPIITP